MFRFGVIEAKKGNPPVMPSVMTPGGPLDLSSVLFRNRIIFIGQPINAQVAQRVISQLVTLASIDDKSDILVSRKAPFFCKSLFSKVKWSHVYWEVISASGVLELSWWQHLLRLSNLWLYVLGKFFPVTSLQASYLSPWVNRGIYLLVYEHNAEPGDWLEMLFR